MIRMESAHIRATAFAAGLAAWRFVGVACPAAATGISEIAVGAGVRRSREGGPPQDPRP